MKFFAASKMSAILGAQEFIDRIRRRFYGQHSDRHVPQSRILALPIDFITQVVAEEYGSDPEALMLSRRGVFNEPRNAAIYLAPKRSGKTLLEIGAAFNMSQYSSVSSVVTKMQKVLTQDKRIRKRVCKIEKALRKGQ